MASSTSANQATTASWSVVLMRQTPVQCALLAISAWKALITWNSTHAHAATTALSRLDYLSSVKLARSMICCIELRKLIARCARWADSARLVLRIKVIFARKDISVHWDRTLESIHVLQVHTVDIELA